MVVFFQRREEILEKDLKKYSVVHLLVDPEDFLDEENLSDSDDEWTLWNPIKVMDMLMYIIDLWIYKELIKEI